MRTPEERARALRAVGKVGHAVKIGRLIKTPCADCGSTANIQGHHHEGYDPEHELDVVWLCRDCHLRRHGKLSRPTWRRTGTRAYMERTRAGVPFKDYAFGSRSYPDSLLKKMEVLWSLFRTDEERAYALALIERLAAEGTASEVVAAEGR